MKKIWIKIRIFFFYLFKGLISADKIIKNDNENNISQDSSIEQEIEQQSVFKDLLKGELTEEVKELRHEMYYAERRSHEYSYNGGGNAKKNNLFDYKGSAEMSDGNPIKLVLNNKQIINSLCDDGVAIYGSDVAISEELQGNFNIPISKGDEKYCFDVTRKFFPRFKIEKYTTKLIVKDILNDEKNAFLDFYIPMYKQQFNNITKLFQSELDRIYQGDVKSDLLDFDKISFITKNCYGAPDLFLFEYDKPTFIDIIKFDGCYVLRFKCNIVINGEDTLTDIYHEATDKKIKNKERRKNAKVDFTTYSANIDDLEKQKNDLEESEKLFDKILQKGDD